MSMHEIEITDLERAGLEAHGLPVDAPSQLSDAFRQGMAWATRAGQPRLALEELAHLLKLACHKLSDVKDADKLRASAMRVMTQHGLAGRVTVGESHARAVHNEPPRTSRFLFGCGGTFDRQQHLPITDAQLAVLAHVYHSHGCPWNMQTTPLSESDRWYMYVLYYSMHGMVARIRDLEKQLSEVNHEHD